MICGPGGNRTRNLFIVPITLVDPAGFEPATSSLQMKRSTTKLRARQSYRESSTTNLKSSFQ